MVDRLSQQEMVKQQKRWANLLTGNGTCAFRADFLGGVAPLRLTTQADAIMLA